MPEPRDKFTYREGDLKIEYPDGTVVDPRANDPQPQEGPDTEDAT